MLLLGPVIALGTYDQMSAGIEFSTGEIAGPVAGFTGLGVAGIAVLISIMRAAGSVHASEARGGPSWLPVQ